jgi:tetratricopeptide (TPR) repeat protein
MRWLLAAAFVTNLAASDLLVAGGLVSAGDQLLEQGKTQEAIGVLKKATEISPQSAFAWYRLAMAYQAAGQGQEKMAALRNAFEADPENRQIGRAWVEALVWFGQGGVGIHTDCWGSGGSCAPGALGFVLAGRRY